MAEPEYLAPRETSPQVFLAEPDAAWARQYADQEAVVRATLGPTLISIEHVGSTSVPGLPAKPVIDIALVVADPADESAYVRPLEAAGYEFHLREPDWHQHRLFKRGTPHLPYDEPRDGPRVNLHVFPEGCDEVRRMSAFRAWLVEDEADRLHYARTKRELAAGRWDTVQDYADAKSEVVAEIMERALSRVRQPSKGDGSPAPTRTTSG